MDQDNQSSRGIPRELAQNLVAAVREEQIANEIVDDHVALFLGINRTDGRCLDIVERHGRMTAGALATESGMTTGAVTAVTSPAVRPPSVASAPAVIRPCRSTMSRHRPSVRLIPRNNAT